MSVVIPLNELPPHSVAVAGGKGASLGDMLRADLPVPPGFVVAADAFRAFLERHDGARIIDAAVNGLDVHDDDALKIAAEEVRAFILSNPLPSVLSDSLRVAYAHLGGESLVAVRSSAISEDGEGASFAGQQETFLNVRGVDAVVEKVKECWASFFAPRAMFYRAQKGSLADTEMAVVVQQMVNPQKSGVLFTIDPVQGRRDHMMIEAIYGLGEGVVSGQITPDQYVVDRDDGSLVREHVTVQPIAFVLDENGGGTQQVTLPEDQGRMRVLTDDELARLLQLGLKLEAHFGSPQDVEWCLYDGDVFLLQSRPITTL